MHGSKVEERGSPNFVVQGETHGFSPLFRDVEWTFSFLFHCFQSYIHTISFARLFHFFNFHLNIVRSSIYQAV